MSGRNAQRRRGFLLIVVGVAIGSAFFVALIALSHMGVIAPTVTERIRHGVVVHESKYNPMWGIPMLLPLFMTLTGLIKLVTGRSFPELAKAYETMSGGRRFVVSVFVLALALAVIFGLVAIAFAILL